MKLPGLILCLWSTAAVAAPSLSTTLDDHHESSERPRISLGLSSNLYEYEESKMREDSSHQGFLARVQSPADSIVRWSAEYEFFRGTGTYNGQTWGGSPLVTQTQNLSHVLKGTVGLRNFHGDTITLTPFVGLGYRYLLNKDNGPGSYTREIHAAFLPVGFEWSMKPADRWSVGFSIEADAFLGGSTTSFLSESNAALPDLENEQKIGSGSRIATEITYAFNEFSVSVRPFVQVWNLEDSERQRLDQTNDLVEPKNSTRIVGTDVLVTF